MHDALLLSRLRDGDPVAFDAVYARYAARVHAFVLRMVRDPSAADDIAQDTWVAFARAAASLREGSDLAAFLFTIARNEARSHRRWSLLDLARLVGIDEASDLRDATPGPEQRSETNAAAQGVERALAALPAGHREVLLLVCVEGFEQERAAAILGLSYAALRQRLARARAALGEALERQEQSRIQARRAARGAT